MAESDSYRPEDILRQQGESWLRAARRGGSDALSRADCLRMAREFFDWARQVAERDG
ncbi:hypothetical protein GCM10027615_77770 [Plantactinospora veratri]